MEEKAHTEQLRNNNLLLCIGNTHTYKWSQKQKQQNQILQHFVFGANDNPAIIFGK